ncbi:MAG: hypothetical protein QW400_00410 [Candidatus Diapherotrites archaeon]
MVATTQLFDKNYLKKALKRIRQQKLKEIDSELAEKIPTKDFEKKAKNEIKKMKAACFKNRTEQLGYEMLANICNELLKQNKSQISFLESLEKNIKGDFLKREITIREYREMVLPIMEKVEFLRIKTTQLERTLAEALDGLALFKKLPSFISAMHERKSPANAPSLTLCKIFEKIKLEQLSKLEKELMLKYGLTEQELAKVKKKTRMSGLKFYELEKKMKHAISLADRNERLINKEREKERAAELIIELRRQRKGVLGSSTKR